MSEELSDAELLYDYEEELFIREKDSTASSYRTGPRAFVRWLGHDSVCRQSSSDDDTNWLRECLHNRNARSACTSYKLIDNLDKRTVQRFIRYLKQDGYAQPTIRSYFFGLRKLAEIAVDERWLDSHPLRYGGDEKTPLEKYKIRQKNTNKSKWDDEHLVTDLRDSTVVALKAKHVKSVIEHTPDKLSPIRNESIARFLWQTGARAEEASEVRWSDFGEEDGDPDDEDDVGYRPGEGKVRLKTAKKRGTGTETRWVPVHDNLITMLNIWREEQPVVTIPETDYVFSTERSKQMSPNQINRVMRQAFDAAGFDASYTDAAGQQRHKYSAHIMRSSFATYCANEVDEIQLHHLKYLMGHEDISQTMRYVKEDVEGALRAARHGPR